MKQAIKNLAKSGNLSNIPQSQLEAFIAIAQGYELLFNHKYPRRGITQNTAAYACNPWRQIKETLSKNL
jgi:hypothetical protein